MRVAVIGATGNVGTSVLRALAGDPAIESIIGVARRRPLAGMEKTDWRVADVATDDLGPILRGADAVIHLAWLIQPSRNRAMLDRTNVDGSERVFAAAAAAEVGTLVYASSVGAYSPGPKDRAVDESWRTDGIPSSTYSTQKAQVERMLDAFEDDHPRLRVVRLRPALVFKGESASQIRRLFGGPLVPSPLVRRELVPFVPALDRLRFQAVHGDDLGDAYRLAVLGTARGAFNVAAEPVIDPDRLGELLGARPLPVPAALLRAAAAVTWRLRLQPTSEGWVDMALQTPIMDTGRARRELAWEPRRSSLEALEELLYGIRIGRGFPTPPLDPGAGGRFRIGELRTGIGAR